MKKDEDITYTNWGITGSAFEPINDANLGCASMCLGNQCNNSNTWKAVDCNTPQLYICQIECESKALVRRAILKSNIAIKR